MKEYEKLAGRFNPVKFSAKAWVRLAKSAGMKYIVITAKHHDGFSIDIETGQTYRERPAIKPEIASSYMFYHYKLQEEKLCCGNNYEIIGFHENLWLFYLEDPEISDAAM